MIRFKKTKRKSSKKFIFQFFFSIVLIVLSINFFLRNYFLFHKRQNLALMLHNLKSKIKTAKEKRNVLQSEIYRTQTIDYLEKIAREELNFKKKGEKVVAFPILRGQDKKELFGKKESLWQKILEKLKVKK